MFKSIGANVRVVGACFEGVCGGVPILPFFPILIILDGVCGGVGRVAIWDSFDGVCGVDEMLELDGGGVECWVECCWVELVELVGRGMLS